ncbi:LytR/AlgR family response regulator transcription factor [Arsenicibacter rosenii]|uniref:DNA-binding response regulator n=1 Tax=Arsenicibacter rosenii TaxID=1750698 RepID=A0A1S2VKQ3_9BACT|nr:response regulator [Arsenicibacter rosenii]OIN59333.1 hypothetical protein BLX24_10150 [Arsenicibacter rosenii]
MTTSAIKILLIEDEFILGMDIADTLTAEGYRVVGVAEDYTTALELFQAHTPDLVLCDVQIQGPYDGIGVIRRLSAIRSFPVIYLTAFTDTVTFNNAKETRPAAYLVKPYQLSTLRTSIELALHRFTEETIEAGTPDEEVPEHEVTLGRDSILRIDEVIFIKKDGRFIKIQLTDIICIIAEGNYVMIKLATTRYLLRLSLGMFLEKVNYSRLVRTHRSYAVNVTKVDNFTESEVMILDQTYPISRQYRDDFLRSFMIR